MHISVMAWRGSEVFHSLLLLQRVFVYSEILIVLVNALVPVSVAAEWKLRIKYE